MKYTLFIFSIIASTHSIVAMETPYETMITKISQSSQGKPSIILINSDLYLDVSAGALLKDGKKTEIRLHPGTQLALSPYAHPFFLNEEQKKTGAMLQLSMLVQRQHRLNLHIGGDSIVKFGDTIHIKHDENNRKIYIIHNEKKTLETLHTSDEPISIGLYKTIKPSKKVSFLKKSKSMS